ncbi:MAG: hypothetical protein AAGC88_03415 [Bacteroidota bacterium]
MDKASKSVLFFGIYILITGLTLLLAPNILLLLLMIDAQPSIWMQLLGLALTALGYYYIRAAHDRNFDFYRGTVPIRIGQFLVVVVLVYIYEGPYILIAVSAIEALAGIITYRLLSKSR